MFRGHRCCKQPRLLLTRLISIPGAMLQKCSLRCNVKCPPMQSINILGVHSMYFQSQFLLTRTFCQKITFDNTDVGGIIVGRFYIDGTIGENMAELLHQNWQPIIFIEVMKINASSFSTLCQFDVSGSACTPDPVDKCQCIYITTMDNVHFVVNGTAGPDLYNAIIRAQWQHQNHTNVYSNKNYTVPGPEVEDTTSVPITSPATDETTTSTDSSSSSSNTTAVSNHGTDSKAKANTNEQSESDRHYSEHPNHAYENERRTSPSNVTVDEVKTTPNDNLQQHNSEKKDVNKSHAKDKTNDGSASQTMPGEPRRLPPLKGTNIHGQLQPTGQPRPPSVEMTSPSVKHNN